MLKRKYLILIFSTLLFVLNVGVSLAEENERATNPVNNTCIASPVFPPRVVDENGIPLYKWTDHETGDNRMIHHPLTISSLLRDYIEHGICTNKPEMIVLAEQVFNSYVSKYATVIDDKIWITYNFDFKAYGRDDLLLKAPWVSGMAQGLWLGLATRLYEITDREYYRDTAKGLFRSINSFENNSNNNFWVSKFDEDGYLWLEEYPMPIMDKTLNGFLEAFIYGVIRYNIVLGDEKSQDYVERILDTINKNITKYIDKGEINRYSLNRRVSPALRLEHYHIMHTRQLLQLYELTGDDLFLDYAGSNLSIIIDKLDVSDIKVQTKAGEKNSIIIYLNEKIHAGEIVSYIFDMREKGKEYLPYLYYDPQKKLYHYRGGSFDSISESGNEFIAIEYNRKSKVITYYYNDVEVAKHNVPGHHELNFYAGSNYSGGFKLKSKFVVLPVTLRPSLTDMLYLEKYKNLVSFSEQ